MVRIQQMLTHQVYSSFCDWILHLPCQKGIQFADGVEVSGYQVRGDFFQIHSASWDQQTTAALCAVSPQRTSQKDSLYGCCYIG